MEPFHGAVTFVDISGFTPLTQDFAKQGPRGAEALSKLLNAYFGQLTDLIASWGGDIVAYAGDAVLAVWPASSEATLDLAARLAAQCSLAVLAELDHYIHEDRELRVRALVSAGPLLASELGGHEGQWQALVSGSPLTELAAADLVARQGEVVLTPSARALLQKMAEVTPRPEGTGVLHTVLEPAPQPLTRDRSVTPEVERQLRRYLPPVVVHGVTGGPQAFLAEFRRVSVVFGSFVTPPASGRSLQEAVLRVQETVRRLDGTICQILQDDKGVLFILAFGLPHHAHEDDAVRAVESSLSLQQALEAAGTPVRVGVSTGSLFCGTYGSASRRSYCLIGSTMNLAARLMAKADTVLCDTETVKSAGDRLTVSSAGERPLKGFADPVPTWIPQARLRSGRDFGTRQVIGRTDEKKALDDALDRLFAGEGGLVLLEGEAGIGKSHLVHHVETRALARGAVAVVGEADSLEERTSWFVFRDLLKEIYVEPAAIREAAQATPLVQWMPLLQDVLELGLEDDELTADITGAARAQALTELIVAMLAARAEQQPLLVIVEDGHWLDSASYDALPQLVRSVPRLLLLLTTRPPGAGHEARPPWRELQRVEGRLHIVLGTLESFHTVELVQQRLDVSLLPPAIAVLISERSEGHPLFAEELTSMLLELGALAVEDGVAYLKVGESELADLDIPRTVQGVITSRIDTLEPSTQLLLKVASVIGRVFPLALLKDVHPVLDTVGVLKQRVQDILTADLAEPELAVQPQPGWIFKHAIVQDVAYALLVFEQRTALHQAVAEWYERNSVDQNSHLALLAYHWERAEQPERAVHYLDQAGAAALRSGASLEAARHFGHALELADDTQTDAMIAARARWYRGLGTARWELGQKRTSREAHEQALAVVGSTFQNHPIRRFFSVLPMLLWHLAWLLAPKRTVARTPELRSAWQEATFAATEIAQACYFDEDTAGYFYSAFFAGYAATRAGPSGAQTDGMTYFGGVLVILKLRWLGEVYLSRARNSAEETESWQALYRHHQVLGTLYSGMGEDASMWENLVRARQFFQRTGQHHQKELTMTIQCISLLQRGRHAEALEAAEDLRRSAAARGSAQHQIWASYLPAVIHINRNHTEGVAEAMERTRKLLEQEPEEPATITVECTSTRDLWLRGHKSDAIDSGTQVLARMKSYAPSTWGLLPSYSALCETFLDALAERPDDRELFALCKASLKEHDKLSFLFPCATPANQRLHGRLAWLRGKGSRARRLLDKSIAGAEAFDLALEKAYCQVWRGMCEEDPSPWFAEALPMLQRHGAVAWLEATEKA